MVADQNKVNELFSAFAGREVGTKAKTSSGTGNSVIIEVILDPADSVIAEMEKIAKDNKLSLVFKTQVTSGDVVNIGFKGNRVTATAIIGKDTRIGDQFKIG